MRINLFISFFVWLILICPAYAVAEGGDLSSVIVEMEGMACMGQTRSREETQKLAESEARRRAAARAMTYVESETKVADGRLMHDIVKAFSNAQVRILRELESGWYEEESAAGFRDICYKVHIKAEVVPDKPAASVSQSLMETPQGPLTIKAWTDKTDYRTGEFLKIFLKGNKPFFATIVYRSVDGTQVQLLPNPRRRDNYFRGGVVYEIPSPDDVFSLMVNPPYGSEDITVFASTNRMGSLDVQPAGELYLVREPRKNLGRKTRGLTMMSGQGGSGNAEFSETTVQFRTVR